MERIDAAGKATGNDRVRSKAPLTPIPLFVPSLDDKESLKEGQIDYIVDTLAGVFA